MGFVSSTRVTECTTIYVPFKCLIELSRSYGAGDEGGEALTALSEE